MDDSRFLQYAPHPLFDGLVHTPPGPQVAEATLARPVTMPAGAPDDMPAPSPSSYLSQTAILRTWWATRRDQWISGLLIMVIPGVGSLGWRTRVSNLRQQVALEGNGEIPPARVTWVKLPDGRWQAQSSYCWTWPADVQRETGVDA